MYLPFVSMKIDTLLYNIQKYLLYILVAIYGVFVLTSFSSPFIVPKEILIVSLSAVVIVVWIIRTIVTGSLSFSIGKFDLGVLLISIAYLLSSILVTPNKMEAFLFPGIATFVIASGIIYFLINQLDKNDKKGMVLVLLISGALVSIAVLFSEIDLFSKIPQLSPAIKASGFDTLGGPIPSMIYLLSVLPLALIYIFKENETVKKIFITVCAFVFILGIIVLAKRALPGSPQAPKFTSFQTSWEVAVETLKVSPIWGIGPGNYLTAFNKFRPISYNSTDVWQVRYTSARDFYLGVLSETGFAGLTALTVLIFSIYAYFRKHQNRVWEVLAILTSLILFAVWPTSPLLLLTFFVILSIFSDSEDKKISLMTTQRIPAFLSTLPIAVGLIILAIFGYKAILGEVLFQKGMNALGANNAKDTYNFTSAAIAANPYVDRYHAALAQIDMALASSIANKKTVSDSDRNTITQLIQQSITEGKSTVVLNPDRAGNWQVLGQIYQSIMPYAQGADQFTVQTYSQAVTLDPTDPNLRIALGGVYYALGRYDDAIGAFKLAILAKPDLANGHYNLAIAYREKKDYQDAITEMDTVLTLIPKDSSDYALAQSTLDNLKKNIPATSNQTQSGSNLQAPQPAQTSNIKPPITLPSEATPPSAIK